MKDIISGIFSLVTGLISSLLDAVGLTPGDVLAVLLAACVVVAVTPFVAQKLSVRIDARRRKIPLSLQRKVTAILCTDICNFYCSRNEYVRERADSDGAKRRPLYYSWLSPYRRAVKVQIKRYGKGSRKERFYPRQLVRDASRFIEIRELTDEEKTQFNASNPLSIYVLTLSHAGKSAAEVCKFVPAIKSALNLHDMFPIDDGSSMRSSWVCAETPIEDTLVSIKRGVEFLEEHPTENVMKVPCGYQANGSGDPVMFPVHQSLALGATGSGKSGFFLTTIFQLKDFITGSNGKKKIVRLYGIDPKNSDLGVFKHSSLFERVESDFEGYISVINEVYSLMKNRNDNKKIDLAAGKTGQSLKITEDSPLILLMIDEAFSMITELNSSREGKAAYRLLSMILAQGRSANVFCMMASQSAEAKYLEGIRFNIVNYVLLRQESSYFNDLFLGEGAAEKGFDSTKIGLSNKGNGYKYSGIGFIRGEDGRPLKFRYPYIAEADVAALIQAHPRRGPLDALNGDGWDQDTPGTVSGAVGPLEASGGGEEELSLWGWEDET